MNIVTTIIASVFSIILADIMEYSDSSHPSGREKVSQAKPLPMAQIPAAGGTFFETKISCGTTSTQAGARAVIYVSLINTSGDSIFISDDSSVAVTDTKIATGTPINRMPVTNLDQIFCITDAAGAKDLHVVGVE